MGLSVIDRLISELETAGKELGLREHSKRRTPMLRRFSRIRALLGKPLRHRAERFLERGGDAVGAGRFERIAARRCLRLKCPEADNNSRRRKTAAEPPDGEARMRQRVGVHVRDHHHVGFADIEIAKPGGLKGVMRKETHRRTFSLQELREHCRSRVIKVAACSCANDLSAPQNAQIDALRFGLRSVLPRPRPVRRLPIRTGCRQGAWHLRQHAHAARRQGARRHGPARRAPAPGSPPRGNR